VRIWKYPNNFKKVGVLNIIFRRKKHKHGDLLCLLVCWNQHYISCNIGKYKKNLPKIKKTTENIFKGRGSVFVQKFLDLTGFINNFSRWHVEQARQQLSHSSWNVNRVKQQNNTYCRIKFKIFMKDC